MYVRRLSLSKRELRGPSAMAKASIHILRLHALKQSTWAMWIAFAAASLVFLSGCATQVRSQLEESLAARKIETLRAWETATVNGKPLLKNLRVRTALLFRNFESLSVKTQGNEVHFEANAGQKEAGYGVAVPIAKDGYFLTAGHVVRDASSLTLLAFSLQGNNRPLAHKAPARIVWGPVRFSRGHDIAVVHAPVGPLDEFAITTEPPQIGAPIVAAGWPFDLNDSLSEKSGLAAGRILNTSGHNARASLPSFFVLRHDAPLVSGDSGGPVLDRDGNLIGVSTSYYFPFWQGLTIALGRLPPPPATLGYYARAIMPDPNWLLKLIQSDRHHLDAISNPAISQRSPVVLETRH